MSWLNLNQSLYSLKGQITNFATEVLSEGNSEESAENTSISDQPINELQEKCTKQELEIEDLKKLTSQLQSTLHAERLSRKNGVKEEEASWYWDPIPPTPGPEYDPNEPIYKQQIQALQEELSSLRDQRGAPSKEELNRLTEENRNLTKSLEDLDNQHQQAMERLLSLKKELQKNFEVLKQEHVDLKASNDEYTEEIKTLHKKIDEKNNIIQKLNSEKSDYETLHHRYQNLEKVYGLMRENAEKFQEENQELHEEVFKLQEQVTKLEHEIEVSAKHDELSNMVSRETYEQLLKELNDLKTRRNSDNVQVEHLNIDDNAKSVIENLNKDIRDLKHKLTQVDFQCEHSNAKLIKPDKIIQLYNKYVNFELPVDYVGEMPAADDVVLFKLESAFKTLNSFKKEIDILEHNLSEKALNANHLQTQIEDLTSENDFLTTDIQHFERELNEMKKNNDFLISEIAALKNTSKLEPIIETHEDNLAKLETELADCNQMNKTFESTIHKIEKELSGVRTEKELLQKSLDDLRRKYTTMLHEFEECKTQTKALEVLETNIHHEHSEKLQSVLNEVHDLKKRLTASSTKNEKLAIDMQILENDKVILIKQVDEMRNALGQKSSRIKEQDSKIKTLEHNVQDLAGQVNELSKKNRDLENDRVNELDTETKIRESATQATLKKENHDYSHLIHELRSENSVLRETLTDFKNEFEEIVNENKNLTDKYRKESEKNNALEKVLQELKAEVSNYETLKSNHKVLLKNKEQLESKCTSSDDKISKLEQNLEKIIRDLNEKESMIVSLNEIIAKDKINLADLNQNIADLQIVLEVKDQQIKKLTLNVTELTEKLNETSDGCQQKQVQGESLRRQNEEFMNEIAALQQQLQTNNTIISDLKMKTEELEKQCSVYKSKLEQKDKKINSLESLIDKEKQELTHTNDEYTKLLQDKETMVATILELKDSIQSKEKEFFEIKDKRDELEITFDEQKKLLDAAHKERAELINLVNLKHNESIQYHTEIQRLNNVILEQTNEFKRLIEESQSNACLSCDTLRTTLREKDQIIMTLNENSSEYQRLKAELNQSSEVVKNLTEKCDYLDKTLAMQIETVKRLTAENAQLSEQESTSSRELVRLRQHLMESEDNHTAELMSVEQKLTECQQRLQQVEERAKQTSTVYTSSSIRANQEVETLRTQIKLLERQRDEVQSRLSAADDARERSHAALANLQLVLEQFQLDKERDIEAATVKLQNKMADLVKQNGVLKEEIDILSAKLEEALTGLQAASRLGDQLETRSAQVQELKEQVRTLQASVAAAEERYQRSICNQQDRVDKSLVKNLLVNYVTAHLQNSTNRTQVLRILSTVLDFNQSECARVGLSSGTSVVSGASGAQAPPPDSLMQEFVKFLEKESRPATPLPTMLGLTSQPTTASSTSSTSRSTTPLSRKNSGLGPQPTPSEVGHRRNTSTGSNNLLLQNAETTEKIEPPRMLATGVNQTRNTEGAILKHVLRDM